MLDDAAFDLESWLASEIAMEFARAEGRGLRQRHRHQPAQGLPRRADLGARRRARAPSARCSTSAAATPTGFGAAPEAQADRPGPHAQGRAPPGRELGDELGDARRSPQAQDRRRRVPVAAGPGRRPARPPARLSGGRGRGHARHRRGRLPDRVRQLPRRLPDRRAQRDQHPARSVHQQAVRPLLRDQADRRPGARSARRSSCSRSKRKILSRREPLRLAAAGARAGSPACPARAPFLSRHDGDRHAADNRRARGLPGAALDELKQWLAIPIADRRCGARPRCCAPRSRLCEAFTGAMPLAVHLRGTAARQPATGRRSRPRPVQCDHRRRGDPPPTARARAAAGAYAIDLDADGARPGAGDAPGQRRAGSRCASPPGSRPTGTRCPRPAPRHRPARRASLSRARRGGRRRARPPRSRRCGGRGAGCGCDRARTQPAPRAVRRAPGRQGRARSPPRAASRRAAARRPRRWRKPRLLWPLFTRMPMMETLCAPR